MLLCILKAVEVVLASVLYMLEVLKLCVMCVMVARVHALDTALYSRAEEGKLRMLSVLD